MKNKVVALIASLLLTVLACSTVAFPAPDPTALPTVQPTQTASPSFTLTTLTLSEEEQTPPYTITAAFPAFVETDDPRGAAFNTLIHELVMREVEQFKSGTRQYVTEPPVAMGSFLDIQYSVIGQAADFWSIKFEMMNYFDGAAHPYNYSITVNYDLEQGREITLDELFLPNSNHLQKISDYCKAELALRDIGFDMNFYAQGVDPLPENYQRWNISHDGLIITFDEYQVAAYAAGPQVVIIPLGELASILDAQSPVAPFLP